MDKYRRVEKPKQQDETISENEIRITTQGKMRNYISYASSLFQVDYQILEIQKHLTNGAQEKGEKTVVLKAMGRAINKTGSFAL